MSDKTTNLDVVDVPEHNTPDDSLPDDDIMNLINTDDIKPQYMNLLNIIYDLLIKMPKPTITQEQFDSIIEAIKKQMKINNQMMEYITNKVVIKQ